MLAVRDVKLSETVTLADLPAAQASRVAVALAVAALSSRLAAQQRRRDPGSTGCSVVTQPRKMPDAGDDRVAGMAFAEARVGAVCDMLATCIEAAVMFQDGARLAVQPLPGATALAPASCAHRRRSGTAFGCMMTDQAKRLNESGVADIAGETHAASLSRAHGLRRPALVMARTYVLTQVHHRCGRCGGGQRPACTRRTTRPTRIRPGVGR